MSRTIRRKGWHCTTSSKWNDQNTNIFYHVRKDSYCIKRYIEDNLEMPAQAEKLQKERHRDSFWKTLRWSQYSMPIPRNMHKMEIKSSLKNGTDYNWDEIAARKYEKGVAQMMWD
ncbi:Hypothetical protein KNT65_gp118 [Escherichia phage EcS1]|uniref:Uncharacterized protein n=1 Tax=Escherichia phage EcS1 TaxID=2083276 RepID=A0A2Z5ZCG8_9CAUD|nr:Hypothetical protein KNT65_gp118 [Escherichia phage EcS1]BBC78166.1 Hypothetical protein [Escherichia phage EcS1]